MGKGKEGKGKTEWRWVVWDKEGRGREGNERG